MRVPPPSAPSVEGWTISEFKAGFRAKVSTVADTMRIEFSRTEVGPDSGVVIRDAMVREVSYAIYVSAPCSLKIPGSAGPVALTRAPGWNMVTVGTRVLVDGADRGPGDPTNLGCYATSGTPPGYAILSGFDVTGPAAVQDKPRRKFDFAA